MGVLFSAFFKHLLMGEVVWCYYFPLSSINYPIHEVGSNILETVKKTFFNIYRMHFDENKNIEQKVVYFMWNFKNWSEDIKMRYLTYSIIYIKKILCFVFFSLSITYATVISEINFGRTSFDLGCNGYHGARVSFDVFNQRKNADGTSYRERIWVGYVQFFPCDNKASIYNPIRHEKFQIKFRYIKTDRIDDIKKNEGDFVYYDYLTKWENEKEGKRGERPDIADIIKGTIFSWKLEDVEISISDVVSIIEKKMKSDIRYSKFYPSYYKMTGWDCHTNVANCVTFSLRFMKLFGINIDCAQILYSLIAPPKPIKNFFSYIILNTLTILKNVQLQFACKQLLEYKDDIKWQWNGKVASMEVDKKMLEFVLS
ncbi:MAG: hypothetical protein HEEMFOPI_01533 [Holosporales bacterium]